MRTLRSSLGISLVALATASAWAGPTFVTLLGQQGDGMGNLFTAGQGIAVDSNGNTFASAIFSENVFRISPGGIVTEILDSSGDGSGNNLNNPGGLTLDRFGNLYVAGGDKVFRVTPAGMVTVLIDSSGDGTGEVFRQARDVAVDPAGNVYVTGTTSDNVFRIAPRRSSDRDSG